MKSTNKSSHWFNIYNNLETLNMLSKKDMKIRKELVINNSFYRNEEKYDILIDSLVQDILARHTETNVKDINKVSLSNKEYWNILYNLKYSKNEKSKF